MSTVSAKDRREAILVLAPLGRDTEVLKQALHGSGIASAPTSIATLANDLRDDIGAVLLTEEAMVAPVVDALVSHASAQPVWSDLPVLVLAAAEPAAPRVRALAALRAVANVTVLERPIRSLPLITAVQAAVRARRRQYELRELILSERVAREAAEAASQVKDEFLATVSHELRTPLSAILLWSRMLTTMNLDEQTMRRGLSAVGRSAAAQSKLIEDLLDVSRMISGKLKMELRSIDLEPVVRAALEVLRPAADAKQVVLDAAIGPLPRVAADPDRMQQVVWNLVSNAIKFTEPGGKVSVHVARREDAVTIEVTDTGKGIDRTFLPHVFERFRQADGTAQRRYGGLGLGLAISRQLVEIHGGVISVESEGEGRGTRFKVELPVPGASATAGEVATERSGAVRRSLTGSP